MNVAIFTDNDFAKVNGVTTSLRAAIRYAPAGHPRARLHGVRSGRGSRRLLRDRRARHAHAVLRRHADVPAVVPRRCFAGSARTASTCCTSRRPGPVGLAALFVAWRTGLRMVGSFHTDLAAYTERLSGSPRLGALMREYLRWPYGRCERVFVPSESTRQLLVAGRINPSQDPSVDARRGHGALRAAEAVGGAPRALARLRQAAGGDLRRPAVEGEGPAPAARRDVRAAPARRGAPPGPRGRRPVSPRARSGSCPTPCSRAR